MSNNRELRKVLKHKLELCHQKQRQNENNPHASNILLGGVPQAVLNYRSNVGSKDVPLESLFIKYDSSQIKDLGFAESPPVCRRLDQEFRSCVDSLRETADKYLQEVATNTNLAAKSKSKPKANNQNKTTIVDAKKRATDASQSKHPVPDKTRKSARQASTKRKHQTVQAAPLTTRLPTNFNSTTDKIQFFRPKTARACTPRSHVGPTNPSTTHLTKTKQSTNKSSKCQTTNQQQSQHKLLKSIKQNIIRKMINSKSTATLIAELNPKKKVSRIC